MIMLNSRPLPLLSHRKKFKVDLLPAANENLRVFALPMGHGDGTIIQCPINASGNGGEISIFDLGSLIKYYEWWDVEKLIKNQKA